MTLPPSTTPLATPLATPLESAAPPLVHVADEVAASVIKLVAFHPASNSAVERRRVQRYPYPYLIQVYGATVDGLAVTDRPIVVVGKHLSENGLGFYHQAPIHERHVIAALERSDGGEVCFLMNLTWCRFTRHGWYESGGRLLEVVANPAARA